MHYSLVMYKFVFNLPRHTISASTGLGVITGPIYSEIRYCHYVTLGARDFSYEDTWLPDENNTNLSKSLTSAARSETHGRLAGIIS